MFEIWWWRSGGDLLLKIGPGSSAWLLLFLRRMSSMRNDEVEAMLGSCLIGDSSPDLGGGACDDEGMYKLLGDGEELDLSWFKLYISFCWYCSGFLLFYF